MVKNCCCCVKSMWRGFKVRRLHNDFLAWFWGHGKNRTTCALGFLTPFPSFHTIIAPTSALGMLTTFVLFRSPTPELAATSPLPSSEGCISHVIFNHLEPATNANVKTPMPNPHEPLPSLRDVGQHFSILGGRISDQGRLGGWITQTWCVFYYLLSFCLIFLTNFRLVLSTHQPPQIKSEYT